MCSRALKLVPAAAEAPDAEASTRCLLRAARRCLDLLRKVRPCLSFKPLDLERMQYTLVIKASDWSMVRAALSRAPGPRPRAG